MFVKIFSRIFITTVGALCAAYLLDGIRIDSLRTALIVSIVLGLLNTFVKPVLIFLTLPITLLTLGLFLLVINIVIIKWAATLVAGFYVDGWWAAFLFSIVVSLVSYLLDRLARQD